MDNNTRCKAKYSRTSMARTLMPRLPRLFRNRSCVPWKKSHSFRFELILGDFVFYIENGILCVLIRIASSRPHRGDSNENTIPPCKRKIDYISLLCLLI